MFFDGFRIMERIFWRSIRLWRPILILVFLTTPGSTVFFANYGPSNQAETIIAIDQGNPLGLNPLFSRPQEETYEVNPPNMLFFPNLGQDDPRVAFQARGRFGNLFLTSEGFLLGLNTQERKLNGLGGSSPLFKGMFIRFLNANADVEIIGLEKQSAVFNIFSGNQPEFWREEVPTFARVRYVNLYPGVDLVYDGWDQYSSGRTGLKGTYFLSPGSDPSVIRWRYETPAAVWINEQGSLQVQINRPARRSYPHKPDKTIWLAESVPESWQIISGDRVDVHTSYQIHPDGTIGFELGAYDPAYPLIIDPTLTFSTYLGGSAFDQGLDLAVDGSRNIYVIGSTTSIDFPSDLPPAEEMVGNSNVFIKKMTRNGSQLIFSTLLGGNGEDIGRAIDVDLVGDIYITGYTSSDDFPTTLPVNEDSGVNAFVAKLGAGSGNIRFSISFGGTNEDQGYDIAADNLGNVFIAGATASDDFPTAQAVQRQFGGGETDAFITRINATGNAYVYSTYLGGEENEEALGLALDRAGNVFITGYTESEDFPLAMPHQNSILGFKDAFLTKVSPDGQQLLFSTYLGVGEESVGKDIVIDQAGNVFIAGTLVTSDSFAGDADENESSGNTDVFAIKVSDDGQTVVFERVFGGGENEEGTGITIDGMGNSYLTGYTESADIPTVNLLQSGFGGGGDAFLAQVSPVGDLVAFNYIGGSETDEGHGIITAGQEEALLIGFTFSDDFPVLNSLQNEYRGSGDVFVLKINDIKVVPTPAPTAVPTPTVVPPEPTPIPTELEEIANSNFILAGLVGGIGLLLILVLAEIGRARRRNL